MPASGDTPFETTNKFEIDKASDCLWTGVADLVAYTESYKDAVRATLDQFEALLNVRFIEVPQDGGPDLPTISPIPPRCQRPVGV